MSTQHIPFNNTAKLDRITGVTTRSGREIPFFEPGASVTNDTLYAVDRRGQLILLTDSIRTGLESEVLRGAHGGTCRRSRPGGSGYRWFQCSWKHEVLSEPVTDVVGISRFAIEDPAGAELRLAVTTYRQFSNPRYDKSTPTYYLRRKRDRGDRRLRRCWFQFQSESVSSVSLARVPLRATTRHGDHGGNSKDADGKSISEISREVFLERHHAGDCWSNHRYRHRCGGWKRGDHCNGLVREPAHTGRPVRLRRLPRQPHRRNRTAALAFDPSEVTISAGNTVRWQFESVPHTVTFDQPRVGETAPADIGPIPSNAVVERTFPRTAPTATTARFTRR